MKTSESCSKWIFVPCFPGDTGNNCESCTEGYGFEYLVTWAPQDGSVGADDNFLIKWGIGVLWANKFLVILPSSLSGEFVVMPSVCYRQQKRFFS